MKRKTKNLVSGLGIVGVLRGAVAGIVALGGRHKADEGFELVDAAFERGGLDDKGVYVDTKASIYTKEAFKVSEVVKIKLDFDSNIEYQIFFYGENDSFISKSEIFKKTEDVNVASNATYARLVITPIWDSDVKEDNQKIGFFEVNKYAKQLLVMTVPTEADDAKATAE